MKKRSLIYLVSMLAGLVMAALLPASIAFAKESPPSLEEMWRIIKQQQAEIDELKAQNALLKEKIDQVPAQGAPAEVAATPPPASASKAEDKSGTVMDIYGHVMTDMGYQVNQNDPDWFDVVRPTKLPSFENEFGDDGNFFSSVRQTRFGVKTATPTSYGDLKTIFEFELFGVGDDAGQTTFRLRHAWGELGQFGAGQYWSTFMDIDVFPNSIEYWGPNGMVFYRNVQARWTPWSVGDSRFAVSLERPGASGDGGKYADAPELEGVGGDFELPDLAAHFRYAQDWGHVQLAGILRQIQWTDPNNDGFDFSGDELGWGFNLSSNYRIGPHVLRGSLVYGEGIQNYMNDASVDIGVVEQGGLPIGVEPIPIFGLVAFLDLNWSEKWTSTIGYSLQDNDLTNGQSGNSFKKGQYALTNLLWHPTPNFFVGPELQWAKRDNFLDGFSSDDFRIQVSAKWSYSKTFGLSK
ncbi:MAG: DcaP family trimeric outer membrane transporter [Desulfofustis sp.]|jgi:uncharacterized coiled-coil protein SlyX